LGEGEEKGQKMEKEVQGGTRKQKEDRGIDNASGL